MITAQSNFGLDLSSSATAQILRGALPGGESKRTFFTVFTLRFRKHTEHALELFHLPPKRVE